MARFERDGHSLVYLKFADGDGAIAFAHQVTDDGYIRLECRFEPGWAHVDWDGDVWQNRQVIGKIADIISP